MNNDQNNGNSSKHTTIGSILAVAGLGLGFFTYAHRPAEGFMDALQRSDSWAFKSEVYYALLFLAALVLVAGALRLAKGLRG